MFCHCLTTSAMWIQNQVSDLEMAKINKEKKHLLMPEITVIIVHMEFVLRSRQPD